MSITKDQLFEELAQDRQKTLDCIQGLSEAQLSQKGVIDEWSIKEVLAHIAAWEEVLAKNLPERLKTGAYPADFQMIDGDNDDWNARETARREHFTAQEQLDELRRNREAILQIVQGLDDATFQRPQPWPQWQGTLAEYLLAVLNEHEQEHREPIEAALKQQ
jgi:uncharacterized damage-inducible protein DinB